MSECFYALSASNAIFIERKIYSTYSVLSIPSFLQTERGYLIPAFMDLCHGPWSTEIPVWGKTARFGYM